MNTKVNFEVRRLLVVVTTIFVVLIGFGATASESRFSMENANAAYSSGDFASAKRQFLELEKISPKDASVLQKIAQLYLLENNMRLSQAYYKSAIANSSPLDRVWPNSIELNVEAAVAYFRDDNFTRAAAHLRKAAGPHGLSLIDEIKVAQQQLELFHGYDPYVMSGSMLVKAQFLQLDPLPVIQLSINGSEPLNFIIDTGAEELAIDTSVATRLGIESVGQNLIKKGVTAGSSGQIGLGKVDHIQIGGLEVQNVPTDIVDMGPISEKLFDGVPISGIIGTRFLTHFLASIDYKNQQLILRQKTPENREVFEVNLQNTQHKRIPISLFYTHMILVEGSFNGQNEGLYMLDTGVAKAGILTSEKKFISSGVEVDWSKSVVGAGIGGEAEALEVEVNEVRIGSGTNSLMRTNISGVILKNELDIFDGQKQLGFALQGLLSHSLFKGSVLTFDFENMNIVIEE